MNISNNSNNSKMLDVNDIIAVNFISMDGNVHYAIIAEKNKTFVEIEEKLYQQYPQYRETNNNFLANGTEILRFKTIKQNKIKNGTQIKLVVPS